MKNMVLLTFLSFTENQYKSNKLVLSEILVHCIHWLDTLFVDKVAKADVLLHASQMYM